MAECFLCGRAMVTEDTHLPLNICRRASCEPEHDHLVKQYAELLNDFDWIAQTARASGSGVSHA